MHVPSPRGLRTSVWVCGLDEEARHDLQDQGVVPSCWVSWFGSFWRCRVQCPWLATSVGHLLNQPTTRSWRLMGVAQNNACQVAAGPGVSAHLLVYGVHIVPQCFFQRAPLLRPYASPSVRRRCYLTHANLAKCYTIPCTMPALTSRLRWGHSSTMLPRPHNLTLPSLSELRGEPP